MSAHTITAPDDFNVSDLLFVDGNITTNYYFGSGKYLTDLNAGYWDRDSNVLSPIFEYDSVLILGDIDANNLNIADWNIAYTHSQLTSGNPHDVTKSEVGLGNVDNIQQMPLSYLDTNTSLGTSDVNVPSQNAVKTYVDNSIFGILFWSRDSNVLTPYYTNDDLNINGNIYTNGLVVGDYNFPISDGNENQIFVTDGNGELSWEDIPVPLNYWGLDGNSLYPTQTYYDVNLNNDLYNMSDTYRYYGDNSNVKQYFNGTDYDYYINPSNNRETPPVLQWLFKDGEEPFDGSTVIDYSGNDYNGLLVDSQIPLSVTALNDKFVVRASNYIVSPDMTDDNYTVSWRFRTNFISNGGSITFFGGIPAYQQNVYVNTDRRIGRRFFKVALGGGFSSPEVFNWDNVVDDDEEHEVTLIFSASGVDGYMDGGMYRHSDTDNRRTLYSFYGDSSSQYSSYAQDSLGMWNIKSWNRSLSAEEVAYNYNNPYEPSEDLLDGMVVWLPCAEGSGSLYNVINPTDTYSIYPLTSDWNDMWDNKTYVDDFHYNITHGFTEEISSGDYIPYDINGDPISVSGDLHPAGNYHNGAETKIKFNPDDVGAISTATNWFSSDALDWDDIVNYVASANGGAGDSTVDTDGYNKDDMKIYSGGVQTLKTGWTSFGVPHTPDAFLSIKTYGNTNSTNAFEVLNNDADNMLLITDDGQFLVNTDNDSADIHLKSRGDDNSSTGFLFDNSAGARILQIRNDGMIGVNYDSPEYAVDMRAIGTVGNRVLNIRNQAGDHEWLYIDNNSGQLFLNYYSLPNELGTDGELLYTDGAGQVLFSASTQSDVRTAYEHSQLTTGNPHDVTKSEVGLGNVDNIQQMPLSYLDTNTSLGTSDVNVPSQNAVKTYVDTEISGIDFSSYVPYTGATTDVNLGTQNIITDGNITSNIFYGNGILDYLIIGTNILVANISGYGDKVGVGTDSPSATLDVNSQNTISASVFRTNSGGITQIQIEDDGDTKIGDVSDSDYVNFDQNGDQTFNGLSGFYPRRLAMTNEPVSGQGSNQIDVGEMIIWVDSDSGAVYYMYNDSTTGIVKVQLT